jgi:hypothetical protein
MSYARTEEFPELASKQSDFAICAGIGANFRGNVGPSLLEELECQGIVFQTAIRKLSGWQSLFSLAPLVT